MFFGAGVSGAAGVDWRRVGVWLQVQQSWL